MEDGKSIVFRLRAAAHLALKDADRERMRGIADDLQQRIALFKECPTNGGLRDIQSAWAHALRVLRGADAGGDNGGRGGAAEPTRLAA